MPQAIPILYRWSWKTRHGRQAKLLRYFGGGGTGRSLTCPLPFLPLRCPPPPLPFPQEWGCGRRERGITDRIRIHSNQHLGLVRPQSRDGRGEVVHWARGMQRVSAETTDRKRRPRIKKNNNFFQGRNCSIALRKGGLKVGHQTNTLFLHQVCKVYTRGSKG